VRVSSSWMQLQRGWQQRLRRVVGRRGMTQMGTHMQACESICCYIYRKA
jgi:hypothetical protein